MGQVPNDIFTVDEIMAALASGALTQEEAQAELARIGVDINTLQQNAPADPEIPPSGIEIPQPGGLDAPIASRGPVAPPGGVVVPGGPDRDPFLDLEQDPETIFRGFTSQQFSPELSGLARQSALRQGSPARLSFLLGQGVDDLGALGDTGGRFREFLRTGGQTLNPAGLESGIVSAAETARNDPTGRFAESFGTNKELFELVNSAAQARTNPLFRRAFDRAARNKFSQFQEQGPGRSFLQFLGGQGGRIFQ